MSGKVHTVAKGLISRKTHARDGMVACPGWRMETCPPDNLLKVMNVFRESFFVKHQQMSPLFQNGRHLKFSFFGNAVLVKLFQASSDGGSM